MSDLDKLIAAVGEGDKWSEAQYAVFGDGTDLVYAYQAAFDGSLDAALRLHEALLPGYALERMTMWHGHPAAVHIWGTHEERDGKLWHDSRDGRFEAESTIPARAWLIAILRALKAQEERKG